MKLLFDHNVDRRLRRHLPAHQISTTEEMGWDRLQNGDLIRAAAAGGFEAFLSIDKKIEHEHNLSKLPLPIVILDTFSNALPHLLPLVPAINQLLTAPLTPALYVISRDGTTVLRLTEPR